jgi:hypothetical protein
MSSVQSQGISLLADYAIVMIIMTGLAMRDNIDKAIVFELAQAKSIGTLGTFIYI